MPEYNSTVKTRIVHFTRYAAARQSTCVFNPSTGTSSSSQNSANSYFTFGNTIPVANGVVMVDGYANRINTLDNDGMFPGSYGATGNMCTWVDRVDYQTYTSESLMIGSGALRGVKRGGLVACIGGSNPNALEAERFPMLAGVCVDSQFGGITTLIPTHNSYTISLAPASTCASRLRDGRILHVASGFSELGRGEQKGWQAIAKYEAYISYHYQGLTSGLATTVVGNTLTAGRWCSAFGLTRNDPGITPLDGSYAIDPPGYLETTRGMLKGTGEEKPELTTAIKEEVIAKGADYKMHHTLYCTIYSAEGVAESQEYMTIEDRDYSTGIKISTSMIHVDDTHVIVGVVTMGTYIKQIVFDIENLTFETQTLSHLSGSYSAGKTWASAANDALTVEESVMHLGDDSCFLLCPRGAVRLRLDGLRNTYEIPATDYEQHPVQQRGEMVPSLKYELATDHYLVVNGPVFTVHEYADTVAPGGEVEMLGWTTTRDYEGVTYSQVKANSPLKVGDDYTTNLDYVRARYLVPREGVREHALFNRSGLAAYSSAVYKQFLVSERMVITVPDRMYFIPNLRWDDDNGDEVLDYSIDIVIAESGRYTFSIIAHPDLAPHFRMRLFSYDQDDLEDMDLSILVPDPDFTSPITGLKRIAKYLPAGRYAIQMIYRTQTFNVFDNMEVWEDRINQGSVVSSAKTIDVTTQIATPLDISTVEFAILDFGRLRS